MNYIELNLGGQLRGLKFNNAAVDTYWQRVHLTEIAASTVYATIYAGLIGNDIANGQQSTFTFKDVSEWVDELYNEDESKIKEACDLFAETDSYKKRLEKIKDKVRALREEGEVKKKAKKGVLKK